MEKLRMLMQGAMGREVPAEFSAENYDYETALRDELSKLAKNINAYRRNKYDIFELLAETLDEVLPSRVEAALNRFCEIRRVPQGARLQFRTVVGKQRGKQFVTRATESGVYETFRLDHDTFDVYPVALGGAGIIDFERYLDGIESIADIYEVIEEGIVDRIFEMVQTALLESWNAAGRPAKNKHAVNGFDPATMRDICNTVAAYGAPTIYCSPEFASEMINVITYDTTIKIPDQDALEIRERGYIGKFYGTPVVVLPQSFADEQNSKKVINPSFAYVLPAGREKLVKVCFEGDSYFDEWKNRDNGREIQGYVKVGVGIVSNPNFWGIYYNSAIDAGEWTAYNTELLGDTEIEEMP